MNNKAAIDLGTNTARLLIGSCSDGVIDQAFIMRRITRLGGGFSAELGISVEAQARSLQAMKEFSAKIKDYGITSLRAVATSAVRDSVNGRAFCRKVFEETGITLEVIDGDTEGILTLQGVISGLDSVPDNLLVFDVGGGSTEYVLAKGRTPVLSTSLPLGVVRLTEGKHDTAAMEEKIDRELSRLMEEIGQKGLLQYTGDLVTVGTAGTATTLAAISISMTEYDYRKVNNLSLTRGEIQAIYSRLLPLTPNERLDVPGLEKGREDLIIAGTLLTLKTLELFNSSMLKVSDYGLLEGVLLSIEQS